MFLTLPDQEDSDSSSRQRQAHTEQEITVIAPLGNDSATQYGSEEKCRLNGTECQICVQRTEIGG